MNDNLSLKQRVHEMLMESQYWPPETMLEFQRSQLKSLLKHAKENVPFYKSRLDPVFKKKCFDFDPLRQYLRVSKK